MFLSLFPFSNTKNGRPKSLFQLKYFSVVEPTTWIQVGTVNSLACSGQLDWFHAVGILSSPSYKRKPRWRPRLVLLFSGRFHLQQLLSKTAMYTGILTLRPINIATPNRGAVHACEDTIQVDHRTTASLSRLYQLDSIQYRFNSYTTFHGGAS